MIWRNLTVFLLILLFFVLFIAVEKEESENIFYFFSENLGVFMTFYCAILIYIHLLFLQILNYFLRVLIVTDTRFIEVRESLFFQSNIESVDLVKIQDIQGHKNGVFETVFDYGNLNITLANIQDAKIIAFVPDPLRMVEHLNTLKRRLIFTHEQLESPGIHKPQMDPNVMDDVI